MSVVLGAANKDIRAAVATRMLDKGFAIAGGKAAVQSQIEDMRAKSEAVESYGSKNEADDYDMKTSSRSAMRSYNPGSTGVQFGAFSSRNSAQVQQKTIRSMLGLDTGIEQSGNGMFRVRANGLSESASQNACSRAKSAGLDCFVFH
jgi:hypothetical protein